MSAASSVLYGKRVLVTRAKEQAASFSNKITALGGIPVEIPLIKIQAPHDVKPIERALNKIFSYDWIVLTSANGVHYFFSFLNKYNIEFQENNRPKIAVVGKKTELALNEKGMSADLIPDEFVAESLSEKLANTAHPEEAILLVRGNLARFVLPDQLKEKGFLVEDLIIYETVLYDEMQEKLIDLLQNQRIDIITFTSPSTVTNFIKLLKGTNWRDFIADLQIACIGPITAKAAMEARIGPLIVAKEYTVDGLLDALICANQKEEMK